MSYRWICHIEELLQQYIGFYWMYTCENYYLKFQHTQLKQWKCWAKVDTLSSKRLADMVWKWENEEAKGRKKKKINQIRKYIRIKLEYLKKQQRHLGLCHDIQARTRMVLTNKLKQIIRWNDEVHERKTWKRKKKEKRRIRNWFYRLQVMLALDTPKHNARDDNQLLWKTSE